MCAASKTVESIQSYILTRVASQLSRRHFCWRPMADRSKFRRNKPNRQSATRSLKTHPTVLHCGGYIRMPHIPDVTTHFCKDICPLGPQQRAILHSHETRSYLTLELSNVYISLFIMRWFAYVIEVKKGVRIRKKWNRINVSQNKLK